MALTLYRYDWLSLCSLSTAVDVLDDPAPDAAAGHPPGALPRTVRLHGHHAARLPHKPPVLVGGNEGRGGGEEEPQR